jgi:hypothetical protein
MDHYSIIFCFSQPERCKSNYPTLDLTGPEPELVNMSYGDVTRPLDTDEDGTQRDVLNYTRYVQNDEENDPSASQHSIIGTASPDTER